MAAAFPITFSPNKTHQMFSQSGLSFPPPNPIKSQHARNSMHVQVPSSATNFGFKNLLKTFMVEVYKAENRPLNVPLIAPFTIASSRLEKVENVAIRIELKNGCVGWGEAPILPFVTAEDQPTAMAKAKEACEMLKGCSFITLGAVLGEICHLLPGHQFASVRAGVEMALIDAAAKSIGVPLWRLFGGASNTITTDITIPIVSPAEAAALASKYREQGFETLKLKVGKNLKADIEVLQAIRAAHPDCSFILDANEGYRPEEAIEVLEKLHEMGVTPVLFEQPVHRDDWEGLGRVSRFAKSKYGVSVAADESSRNLADVKKIVQGELADVVNIKLAKVGVLGWPWALPDILPLASDVSNLSIWILPFSCLKIPFLKDMKVSELFTSSRMPQAMVVTFTGKMSHEIIILAASSVLEL
ncbi:hypothetical protein V6N11_058070 [Hibiscus sabdariffa]|uniref:Dipeptide epimerase n=1 Tax=Hibiscus sabdariffa TaxID=183260 RepID=A0ABR2N832_9ROSI